MNLRRQHPHDSLYMLLDTMCNAFGGIILIAVLVVVLTKKAKLTEGDKAGGAPPQYEGSLTEAETNLQRSLQLSQDLQARMDDPRSRQQTALLAERAKLQEKIQEQRDLARQEAAELDATSARDPAERAQALAKRLAEAEARQAKSQQSLTTTNEYNRELQKQLAELERKIAAKKRESVQPLRLPTEHEADRETFYVLIQFGRLYPWKTWDFKIRHFAENDAIINWAQKSADVRTAQPIPGRGFDPVLNAREIQAFFRGLPKDYSYYVAFCVAEDSFAAFNRAKPIFIAEGISYGWAPLHNRNFPLGFSSTGHHPKPQ